MARHTHMQLQPPPTSFSPLTSSLLPAVAATLLRRPCCEIDAELQAAPLPLQHQLREPPGGGARPPWSTSGQDFVNASTSKQATRRHTSEACESCEPTPHGWPSPRHGTCTNDVLMTDVSAMTLEGSHPHFCRDDPAFITEMAGILFDGATFVVHDHLWDAQQHPRRHHRSSPGFTGYIHQAEEGAGQNQQPAWADWNSQGETSSEEEGEGVDPAAAKHTDVEE